MRFWFEHSSEVSLREQIVTQVMLGILCGELAPGERLPSIRDLARRFDLHANTISTGYRQLDAEGWVESRRGSGVYVRSSRPSRASAADPELILARLVANLFEHARRLGIPAAEVLERVRVHTSTEAVHRLLLVEPDPELRAIVLAELLEFAPLPVQACDLPDCAARSHGALLLALPSKYESVKSLAPASLVFALHVRSVPASLAERLPPAAARTGQLVGIASRWPDFLRFARTMLVAAGLDADALVVRDARQHDWREGLARTAAVVCDAHTAEHLPGLNKIVSLILADTVPESLRRAAFPRGKAL